MKKQRIAQSVEHTKVGASTSFDQDVLGRIASLVAENEMGPADILENFMLFYRRVNFAKLLSHMEIFQHVRDIPGSVVECGVFKGASLLTFSKMLDIYCPGDTLKKVIGFDTFCGFPELSPQDGQENERFGVMKGGWNAGDVLPLLEQTIQLAQEDSMIPRFKRVELVKGDACKTIPEYVKANPGLRISLLHLDMDIYAPTLAALEHLYPLVVSGGVVLLDEYAMAGFPGESAAFDAYFKGRRPRLRKFPFISTPGGYFIKDC